MSGEGGGRGCRRGAAGEVPQAPAAEVTQLDPPADATVLATLTRKAG